MNLFKSLLVATVLFLTSSALAGFHMEPYLGFALSGGWDNGTRDDSLSQTNYGIRLGYQAPMGLHVGGDIQASVGTYKAVSVTNTDLTVISAAAGPYLGYQSPFGFRGSAAYMISSRSVIDDANNTTLIGSGFKLSAGYAFIKWLAVNLEYHTYTNTQFEDNLTVGTQDLGTDFKVDMIMVSVSFPFDFGGKK